MTTPSSPCRIGQIIRLKPSQVVAYKELHANVWPEVLQQIHECNIRNCKQ
jgi:L-rhamnose mutarotase